MKIESLTSSLYRKFKKRNIKVKITSDTYRSDGKAVIHIIPVLEGYYADDRRLGIFDDEVVRIFFHNEYDSLSFAMYPFIKKAEFGTMITSAQKPDGPTNVPSKAIDIAVDYCGCPTTLNFDDYFKNMDELVDLTCSVINNLPSEFSFAKIRTDLKNFHDSLQ